MRILTAKASPDTGWSVTRAADDAKLFLGDYESCIKFIKGLDNAILPKYLDVRLISPAGVDTDWHITPQR